MKRHIKKLLGLGRKDTLIATKLVKNGSASTQKFEEAGRLLSRQNLDQCGNRQENLIAAIDLTLQGIDLSSVENAEALHEQGHITQEECQRRVDEALDSYNRVGKDDGQPLTGPTHISLEDGTLIWLG